MYELLLIMDGITITEGIMEGVQYKSRMTFWFT